MEDKIIVAVCGKPELYDSTNYYYRDKYRKDLAWRRVSEETGVAEDVCQKKWKGLRDTYLKERRKELEKRRSGAAAGAGKKWRFSAVLSFLDPFVAPRPTTSNMGQVEEMAEDLPAPPPEEDTSETEDTYGEDTEERSTPSEAPAASSVSDSAPSSYAAAQPPVGRRRTVRPREEPSEVEQELLEALRNRPLLHGTLPPVFSSMPGKTATRETEINKAQIKADDF
ncbi:hypothetical protein CHARACLAT_033161 [Characodon lateralis]|uniref:MADF domain-containing protein n=1 Tax=Characodon lateralis TaxID=208331 RepID=A0ABU7CU23_9TELE|nr:hypothetical protein [Characodon lateralis]